MRWPVNHPGRVCGLCKRRIHGLWVGDEPPPGTCPENAAAPDQCTGNMDAAVYAAVVAMIVHQQGDGPPLQPDRAAFAARGLDPEKVLAFARDEMARQEAQRDFGGYYGLSIQNVSLQDFLGTDPDKALHLAAALISAVVDWLALSVVFPLGEDDGPLDLWRERFQRLMRRVQDPVLDYDPYEDGDVE